MLRLVSKATFIMQLKWKYLDLGYFTGLLVSLTSHYLFSKLISSDKLLFFFFRSLLILIFTFSMVKKKNTVDQI